MHEGDLGGAASGPIWVPGRDRPRAIRAGELATIADTIGGDRVLIQSLDRRRVRFAEIAWKWPDGAAQLHLAPPGTWRIPLGPESLLWLPRDRQVRLFALRPWTPWHERKV